jgi:hypothetical protein
MSSVHIAMIAGLPYTALRDAILTHPTLLEGLNPLFSFVPSVPKSADRHQERDHSAKKLVQSIHG